MTRRRSCEPTTDVSSVEEAASTEPKKELLTDVLLASVRAGAVCLSFVLGDIPIAIVLLWPGPQRVTPTSGKVRSGG